MAPYLPIDAVTPPAIDVDLVADFLELTAFLADYRTARMSDLTNPLALGAAEDHANLHSEMENGQEEVVSSALARIQQRETVLGSTYPFLIDDEGDMLKYEPQEGSFGQMAYLLSLVLSNLRSVSPVLDVSDLHPEPGEERKIRQYFQYVATAALAAEVHGEAWSFGFPRPDRTGFIEKLKEIWKQLGDGFVEVQVGAPQQPKDDQIDVFAARLHCDGLPGIPLAVAQVATGRDAKQKSLRGHISAFKGRWFRTQPVTDWMIYMIMPFARTEDEFVDDVRVLGNVLHRLRVPRRVAEAGRLVDAGVRIEGYHMLKEIPHWIDGYRQRTGAAA